MQANEPENSGSLGSLPLVLVDSLALSSGRPANPTGDQAYARAYAEGIPARSRTVYQVGTSRSSAVTFVTPDQSGKSQTVGPRQRTIEMTQSAVLRSPRMGLGARRQARSQSLLPHQKLASGPRCQLGKRWQE